MGEECFSSLIMHQEKLWNTRRICIFWAPARQQNLQHCSLRVRALKWLPTLFSVPPRGANPEFRMLMTIPKLKPESWMVVIEAKWKLEAVEAWRTMSCSDGALSGKEGMY